jgi:GTP-binding protein
VNIEATFVRSAAGASDFPQDGLSEVALVGRSNVGKSSLINALTRQRVARTSAAPGKTRLANIYRVARAPRRARGALSESKGGAAEPFYLVDLPGFGYARGGGASAREFEELTRIVFGRDRQEGRARPDGISHPAGPAHPARPAYISALLLVDARHPGLESDREAWQWLERTVERCAIVATKIDKLARGERIRALRELESVFENAVLPVSAVTGEGLDELWKLIDRLRHRSNPLPRSNPLLHCNPLPRNPAATDRPPRPRRKS